MCYNNNNSLLLVVIMNVLYIIVILLQLSIYAHSEHDNPPYHKEITLQFAQGVISHCISYQ